MLGFIPAYQSALIVSDLVTALLFGQFAIVRSTAVLVLAGAYVFTAVMAACHLLTFPGLFSSGGLLGASTQSTAWIYMFWHAGFPIAVIAYTALKSIPRATPRRPAGWVVGCVLAAVALALAFTFLSTAGASALPPIMRDHHYTPTMIFVVSSVWCLSLVAALDRLASVDRFKSEFLAHMAHELRTP